MILIVMGVSGSGKTTIGSLLAKELQVPFYDADNFHPQANRDKMAHGIPLTDDDRIAWLDALCRLIDQHIQTRRSCVLACSALKKTYQNTLSRSESVHFIYLKGNYELIEARLKKRKGHYMPLELLPSQFEILEEPINALVVDISHSPGKIIDIIRKGIEL